MFSLIFLLNVLISTLCCLVYSQGMIDPTDMRYYDISTKRMRSPPPVEGKEAFESSTSDENSTAHVQDLRKFEIFLERFINHMLSTANLKVNC